MTCFSEFETDLKTHHDLCADILALTERENDALRGGEPDTADATATRKKLLARLAESLDKVREHRIAWTRLDRETRQQHPEITELLRRNQDLVMKILVLDRENEQALLRKGLLPARHVPPANRQRPHFVASMYQRNSVT